MAFFDLNIPFPPAGPDPASQKKNRVRLVVKAMELGYAGIASNQTIRGAISDSDKCSIQPLPLPSLLQVAPALSSSVRFHRSLLQSSVDAPFRQYNRLTVAVEAAIHVAALNSSNPVLKTYDLVAVQPLNQMGFDQACKVSEVDLISIDFSQKLPFRLKLPMVKAAMERGVYFELIYSSLISDVQSRKNMLGGSKILVNWTRGKNIILSSGSLTVSELRGPCDATNLGFLLGFSNEHAKAALSKNCRALITTSLRKKQFYKEAIKVERISCAEDLDSFTWDPISSGCGDLSFSNIDNSPSTLSREGTDGQLVPASNESAKTLDAVDQLIVLDGLVETVTSEADVSDAITEVCKHQLVFNEKSEFAPELVHESRAMVCSATVQGSDNENTSHNEEREPLYCAESNINSPQYRLSNLASYSDCANLSLRSSIILAPFGIDHHKSPAVSASSNADFHISTESNISLAQDVNVSDSALEGLDMVNLSSGIHDVLIAENVGDQTVDDMGADTSVDQSVAKDINVIGAQINGGSAVDKSMAVDLIVSPSKQSDLSAYIANADFVTEKKKHNYAISAHNLAGESMNTKKADEVPATSFLNNDELPRTANGSSKKLNIRLCESSEKPFLDQQDLDCKSSDIFVDAKTLKHDEVSRVVNKLLLKKVSPDTVKVLSRTIPELSVHIASQERDNSFAIPDNFILSDRKQGNVILKRKSPQLASLFPSRSFLRNMHYRKKRRK